MWSGERVDRGARAYVRLDQNITYLTYRANRMVPAWKLAHSASAAKSTRSRKALPHAANYVVSRHARALYADVVPEAVERVVMRERTAMATCGPMRHGDGATHRAWPPRAERARMLHTPRTLPRCLRSQALPI